MLRYGRGEKVRKEKAQKTASTHGVGLPLFPPSTLRAIRFRPFFAPRRLSGFPPPPLPLPTASCAAIHRLEWERRKRRKVARKKGGGGGGLGPTKKAAFWDDVVGGREGRARLTCAHTIFLLFHFFCSALSSSVVGRTREEVYCIPTDSLEEEMKMRELQNLEMFNLLFINAALQIAC